MSNQIKNSERSEMQKISHHKTPEFSENISQSRPKPRWNSKKDAVEDLITQNNDLASRLEVSLRKISQQEAQLDVFSDFKKKFRFHYESLKDKAFILHQKCEQLQKDNQKTRQDVKSRDDYIEKLTLRNEALNKEYKNLFQEQNKLLSLSNNFSKYRKNIKQAYKSLREKYQNDSIKFVYQKAEYTKLQDKIEEAARYIQEQNKNHLTKQHLLTRGHNSQIEKFKAEITVLFQSNTELKEVHRKNITLHNDSVSLKRKYQELTETYQSEKTKSNEGNEQLKNLLNKYEDQLKAIGEENHGFKSEAQKEREENKNLKEQVANLQELWKTQTEKQEELKTQNTSLQKLNQSLSINLNSYRREIQNFKTSNVDRKNTTLGKSVEKDKLAAKKESKIQFLIKDIELKSTL